MNNKVMIEKMIREILSFKEQKKDVKYLLTQSNEFQKDLFYHIKNVGLYDYYKIEETGIGMMLVFNFEINIINQKNYH